MKRTDSSSEDRPILVSVNDARRLLGGLGKTRLYECLRDGTLKSVKLGKRRLVRVDSIYELIETAESQPAGR